MPSIVTDEALKALGIEIPDFSKNQNARIIFKRISSDSNEFPRFHCRCGRKFMHLSSFIFRCAAEHLNTNLLVGLNDITSEKPLMNIKKCRKRIQLVKTGKIKFDCSECNAWFTERYKYNDHISTHSNPMLKCCSICKTEFSSIVNFRKHIIKFHPDLHRERQEERKQTKEVYRKWNPPKHLAQIEMKKLRERKKPNESLILESQPTEEDDLKETLYENIEHLDQEFLDEIEKTEIELLADVLKDTTELKEAELQEMYDFEPVEKVKKKERKKRRIFKENEYRMPSREMRDCDICGKRIWPCNMKAHLKKVKTKI